uniref:Hint domain-containing protein n=1 Tax=Setaria digitata TaxID=48799 RepID=A0A915Q6K1_9BILA
MVNEDVQITAHTENDCFVYDLPDGTNGTTAEELEKEDENGYMLLKNLNKVPEQFADFSGYRLRLYLLRKKEPSQFVVKGVERNEVGYRITICSTLCQKDIEKKNEVIQQEKHVELDKKDRVIDGNNLNQIKIALRNLTDDEHWIFVAWTEWSYKQQSEWSTLHKLKFDKSDGTRLRSDRHRINRTEAEMKSAAGGDEVKLGSIKLPTEIPTNQREDKKKKSGDCDDDEKSDTEMSKGGNEQEERKLQILREKHIDKGEAAKENLEKGFPELHIQENLKTESNRGSGAGEKEHSFITRVGVIDEQTKDGSSSEMGQGLSLPKAFVTESGKGSLGTQTVRVITSTEISRREEATDGTKKTENKKSDVKEEKRKDDDSRGKVFKEKLSKEIGTNQLLTNQTAAVRSGISKESKKEKDVEQKIFSKSSENQEGRTKHNKSRKLTGSGSTQLPKPMFSNVTKARQAASGHDPIPIHPVPAREAQMQNDAMPPMNCFSANTKVYTQNGEKTMKEVAVGDFVLVPVSKSQLRYERVEMFYHREPETRAKFVVLETESGRKLSLTELHLLPLGDCDEMRQSMNDVDIVDQWLRKSKFAHKARIGDCVFTISSNHELQVDHIVKVGRQYLKGIYSPMTVEGSIVADGVLTSCFSQVESHFSQKSEKKDANKIKVFLCDTSSLINLASDVDPFET